METKNLLEAGTSERWIFYTGPILAVNHPATRFEKFFTRGLRPVLSCFAPQGHNNSSTGGPT
ncbi:MAG TPA: hypothetical protein VN648_27180, partial [Candidatus Methylomirabilis sp.]|nr:hypothetical protein [Candidatus Methylomirabilis sp.]